MDYFKIISLFLTFCAALLALKSEPVKNRRPTKTGWIAMVAMFAFLCGIGQEVVNYLERGDLSELACAEIRPHIQLISETKEKAELLEYRDGGQDMYLWMQFNEKIEKAKNELNAVAARQMSYLDIDGRKKLIDLISGFAVIDNVLSEGFSEGTVSLAATKLYQMEQAGLFELCSD